MPKFKKIVISAKQSIDPPQFKDAYPTNRAGAFMHYWVSCLEAKPFSPHHFEDLLANDFALHFLSRDTKLTGWDSFKQWAENLSQSTEESSHSEKRFFCFSRRRANN